MLTMMEAIAAIGAGTPLFTWHDKASNKPDATRDNEPLEITITHVQYGEGGVCNVDATNGWNYDGRFVFPSAADALNQRAAEIMGQTEKHVARAREFQTRALPAPSLELAKAA